MVLGAHSKRDLRTWYQLAASSVHWQGDLAPGECLGHIPCLWEGPYIPTILPRVKTLTLAISPGGNLSSDLSYHSGHLLEEGLLSSAHMASVSSALPLLLETFLRISLPSGSG